MQPDRPEYTRIRHALNLKGAPSSDFDLNAGRPPIWLHKPRPASVLIPLIERHGKVQVILTKRSQHLKYHAGQISFPGGKLESCDHTPLAAALREASEEIGLDASLVKVLGSCSDHETATGFIISPFVGVVSGDFVARPLAAEVDEVFEVPFGHLSDPGNFRVEYRDVGGQRRRFYVSEFEERYIWGATARILFELATRLEHTGN